jgi:hypothetical protein
MGHFFKPLIFGDFLTYAKQRRDPKRPNGRRNAGHSALATPMTLKDLR